VTHVLALAWEYPPVIEGGLARHVRKLSEALVADGHEVHVLTRGGERLPAREERRGVVVHRVREPAFPLHDIEAFIAWVTRLNADLREAGAALGTGFDVVHSHDWLVADAGRALARTARVPWVVTVHATEHGRHSGRVAQPPQSTIHAAEREMAREADALIACSAYMGRQLVDVFAVPAARVTVIPNGIDPADLPPVPEADLARLRASLAEPRERLVLLVGRLVHEKGFHLALDALPGLIQRVGALRFAVAGAGPAQAELEAQARRLGLERHGTFLGWTGDDVLHALYRVADLCIVPSLYEPFGLVALEAMAAGCPCVVADTGGLREVVPAGEQVGLRFRARDPQALAAMAERLLRDEDLRRRLVAQASEHVLRFDWADVARATAALYAALPAPTPSPQTA
jgi:glycogen synthase